MRKLIFGMLFAFLALGFFACSDKDNEIVEGEPVNGESPDDLLKACVSQVLRSLYDTVFTEMGDTTFTLKVGECINTSEPNTNYIVAKGAEDAALFYNTYCTDNSLPVEYKEKGDSMKLAFDVCDRTTTFGNYGTTSLTIGGESPAYATITIDLAEVGEEHILVFVPESFMPDNNNSDAFQSAYKLGEIVKDSTGIQWLCVQQSSPSGDGYLIRFSDSNIVRKKYKDCCKTVTYSEVEGDGDPLASEQACISFLAMLNWDQGSKAYLAMVNGTNRVKMPETQKVCEIYLKGGAKDYTSFQVGNYWTSDYAYCAKHVKYNYMFHCRNIKIMKGCYWWPDNYVRVSSVNTASDIPMRMKTFKTKKFEKWTIIFSPSSRPNGR